MPAELHRLSSFAPEIPRHEEDPLGARLLTLLYRRILPGDDAAVSRRLNELESFFGTLTPAQAEELTGRLQPGNGVDKAKGDLERDFQRRLASATRRRLREIMASRRRADVTATNTAVTVRPEPDRQPLPRGHQRLAGSAYRGASREASSWRGGDYLSGEAGSERAPSSHGSPPLATASPNAPRAPEAVAEAIDLAIEARRLWGQDPKRTLELLDTLAAYLYDIMKKARTYEPSSEPSIAARLGRYYISRQGILEIIGIAQAQVLLATRQIRLGAARQVTLERTVNGMEGARFYLELVEGEALSFELAEAPRYRPQMRRRIGRPELSRAQVRLLYWFRSYRRRIALAEQRFRVDRRAIAGAIAWEAIEQPKKGSYRAVGPGKMHTSDSMLFVIAGIGEPGGIPQELEERGYLPKRSYEKRVEMLSTPDGAISYIPPWQ